MARLISCLVVALTLLLPAFQHFGSGGFCQFSYPQRYIASGPFKQLQVDAGDFFYLFTDHYDNIAYLSPDMPTFLSFGQWSGLKSNEPEIYLYLEVPIEVTVHGGRFVHQILEEKQRTRIGDHEYKRYRISFSYGKYETRSGMTQLICTTTLNPQADLTAYYSTAIKGEFKHRTPLRLKVVNIPKPGPPSRLHTFFDTFGTSLEQYPDFQSLRNIGFRMLGGFGEVPRDTVRALVKKASKADLELMLWNTEFAKDTDTVGEWNAIGITGEKLPTISPTYRGPALDHWFGRGRELIDDGVFCHVSDPERIDGEKICFSPRTIGMFEHYVRSNFPHTEFMSPRYFLRSPVQYPNLLQLWTDFKSENYADLYRSYKSAMQKHLKSRNSSQDIKLFLYAQPNYKNLTNGSSAISSELPTVRTSLQDPRKLAGIFDLFCPMIYIDINGRHNHKLDMLEVADEMISLRKYLGNTSLPIVPVLSIGFPYTKFNCDIPPNRAMKYQILEAFASGAKGVGIYSEGFFDALDMKFFAEAISEILPVEDIIMEGTVIAPRELIDANAEAFVKGIKADNGDAVILVSEYSNRSCTARVVYRGTYKRWVAVDLTNGVETLPVVFYDRNQVGFEVKLDDVRAKLFWIKTLD